jgi:hypothetical protein
VGLIVSCHIEEVGLIHKCTPPAVLSPPRSAL